ncbi:MAG: hypothetical protein GX595_20065, partial [Lentisphaerae bacterium]|nr:hypothetical protein [Lentisphaerota bacterium]
MRSLRQRLQRIGVVASGLVLAALAAAGGDGLVRHGSFEAADAQGQPVGWSIERRAEVEGRAELVPQARHGRQALHLVHANDKGLWVRASQDHIQARPGARLRFSGWVKAEGTWEVWLYEFLPDGTYKTIVLARGQRTDWQRLRQVVTLGPETRRLKLSLIARPRSEAWFDDMRLDDLDGPARLRVPLLAAAPALDGDLTDAAWSGAAVVDDFLRLGGAGEPASQATRVRLGVADGRLWVAWECSEDRLDEQRLSAAPGWGDDTVEVFLGEPGQAALHHLGVTPAGAALSQVIEPEGGTAYAIDWFSSQTRRDSAAPPELLPCVGAARRGEGRWTAEMAIDLRGRGRPGATWRLQLARSRKVADLEENSTWTLTPGERFLQSERFGHVVMASPIAAPSPERLVAAPPFEAPRQARVVPAPRQCRWTGADPLALAGRVRVASRGAATAAARDLLERVLGQDLGLAVERVEAPLEAIEQHAPALGILKRL